MTDPQPDNTLPAPVSAESEAFQRRRELYDRGLCIDCGVNPHPAGKPRCDDCRLAYLDNKPVMTPFQATPVSVCPHTEVHVEPGSDQVTCTQCGKQMTIVPSEAPQ